MLDAISCVLPPQIVAVWGSSVVVFEPKLAEAVLPEDTDSSVSSRCV